ncbi:MAG: DUF1178 family protein [Alphaproteobacteria bacterium]|nr:DUF1178 family protein [Alphaproteobacteria bacterium]
MIRYALTCANEDQFEGWFASSDDYDAQEKRGQIECPICGSTAIRKAPMAPAVGRSREGMAEMAAKVRNHIREKFDYVGDGFADEARAIHDGDAPDRPIWGEATPEQAREMAEEGLPVAPLPAALAPTPPRKLN